MEVFELPRSLHPQLSRHGVKPIGGHSIVKSGSDTARALTYLLFKDNLTTDLIQRMTVLWGNNNCILQPEDGQMAARFATSQSSTTEYLTIADFSDEWNKVTGSDFLTDTGMTINFSATFNTANSSDQLGIFSWGPSDGTRGIYLHQNGTDIYFSCDHWLNNALVSPAITVNKEHTFTFKVAKKTGADFLEWGGWMDGVDIGTSSITTAFDLPQASIPRCDIGLVMQGVFGKSHHGSMAHIGIWPEELPDAICRELSEDPYRDIEDAFPMMYFTAEAAAAGGSVWSLANQGGLAGMGGLAGIGGGLAG